MKCIANTLHWLCFINIKVGIFHHRHQWSWPWPWTQTGGYNAYIRWMLYTTCITLPLLYYINKLISYFTKCWYHKSQPEKPYLDLDLDLDFEPQLWMTWVTLDHFNCLTSYWLGENTKMTCSSLLHNELWYIFEKINDLQNQGHVTFKSNFPSWKHGKTYFTMLPLSNDTKFMLVNM